MSDDDIVEKIRKKYKRLSGVLDERSRRVWASAEAEALGYGVLSQSFTDRGII